MTELDYINQIKETIQETLDEYGDDDFVNPSLLWEMIKLKVRERSLSYSKHRKKQTKQKAFETIEWIFIKRTLNYFGFGTSLIQWFNIFYCCPESCILNNSWTGDFFEIHRGVRQGCPLSPYLFVLAVEMLAKEIRRN